MLDKVLMMPHGGFTDIAVGLQATPTVATLSSVRGLIASEPIPNLNMKIPYGAGCDVKNTMYNNVPIVLDVVQCVLYICILHDVSGNWLYSSLEAIDLHHNVRSLYYTNSSGDGLDRTRNL
jgi:hypothetical protein